MFQKVARSLRQRGPLSGPLAGRYTSSVCWRAPYMTQHHIIVVSESERLRDVMQSALAGERYRVSSITSAFSDVRAVAGLWPDLLILDWMLGCEDHGLQVLQILQLCQPLSALPMIVCSAPIGLVREIERSLRGSSVQFLLKPFSLPELHHALRDALGMASDEEPPVAMAPAGGRVLDERDAERWRSEPASPPVPLTQWERGWRATPGVGFSADDGPAEASLGGETAAVGR